MNLCKNLQTPGTNSNCDEIFSFYLHDVSKSVNDEFFKKILKFIVLYREYLNIFYEEMTKTKSNVWIGFNYSQIFNANDVPDISNHFVTEFLNSDNGYFGFSKKEAIEFTNNFCKWLYDNSYTCSKLTIIDN